MTRSGVTLKDDTVGEVRGGPERIVMPKIAIKRLDLFLLGIVGLLFPIYPAIVFQQQIHHRMIIWRIGFISLANFFLVLLFFNKVVLKLKSNNVRKYLDEHYTENELEGLIKNYPEYKEFKLPPIFTKDATSKDERIRAYEKTSLNNIVYLLSGLVLYSIILVLLFFFLI